jgi:hypothetical protein
MLRDGVVHPVSEHTFAKRDASPMLLEVRTARVGRSNVIQGIRYDAEASVLEDDLSDFTYNRNRLTLHSAATRVQSSMSSTCETNGPCVDSRSEQGSGSAADAYPLLVARPEQEPLKRRRGHERAISLQAGASQTRVMRNPEQGISRKRTPARTLAYAPIKGGISET